MLPPPPGAHTEGGRPQVPLHRGAPGPQQVLLPLPTGMFPPSCKTGSKGKFLIYITPDLDSLGCLRICSIASQSSRFCYFRLIFLNVFGVIFCTFNGVNFFLVVGFLKAECGLIKPLTLIDAIGRPSGGIVPGFGPPAGSHHPGTLATGRWNPTHCPLESKSRFWALSLLCSHSERNKDRRTRPHQFQWVSLKTQSISSMSLKLLPPLLTPAVFFPRSKRVLKNESSLLQF